MPGEGPPDWLNNTTAARPNQQGERRQRNRRHLQA